MYSPKKKNHKKNIQWIVRQKDHQSIDQNSKNLRTTIWNSYIIVIFRFIWNIGEFILQWLINIKHFFVVVAVRDLKSYCVPESWQRRRN